MQTTYRTSKRVPVTNNETKQRFELEVAGGTAILDYHLEDGVLYLDYAEVPDLAHGQGIAGTVTFAALEWARERRLKVVPVCGYVVAYLNRHPEFSDLLESTG